MSDIRQYIIELSGRASDSDLRGICPPGFQVVEMLPGGLVFRVETDQAGLMGLMRALHARGMVFDAVKRLPNLDPGNNQRLKG